MTHEMKMHGASQPTRFASRLSALACSVAGVALLAVSPTLAQAQRTTIPVQTTLDSMRADGTVKKVPLTTAPAFNLFAAEDLAAGSPRSTGTVRGGMSNEGGPGSVNQNGGLAQNHLINNQFFQWFEMGFVAGAPPNEFRKIRAIYPGINSMAGSQGYTAHYWQVLAPPITKRIGSADGQIGKAFAGVTATSDATCRNDNSFIITGFSLLAMKDCPDTWASTGFGGKLIVPDSVWLKNFSAQGANFKWDDWRIPRAQLDANSYLGTSSTFGFMSDYFREQKLKYGTVVPGGAGAPQDRGYPLGLEMRADLFQFGAPASRNTQFYSVTMVNKSADVYGTGIDYDSLYFGLGPGILMNGTGGQNASLYFDFSQGTVFMTKQNTSGKCSSTFPKGYGTTFGPNCTQNTSAFAVGVFALTWLKSPLGDLRNKLFSDPTSKYYNPTHPNTGDTITFNHWKANSFGQTSQNIARSSRSAFGMFASKEDDYLDGRSPSDFSVANYVTLFQPEDWSGTFPAVAKFNKFVPGDQTNPATGLPFGKWDYNHDGVQDTIFVPGCGRSGCAGLYSDSSAGGFQTNGGNILNTMTAGPFKLKANDTTQFLFAFTWGADSIAIKNSMAGMMKTYLQNYAGPESFAFPTVAIGKSYSVQSASLVDSTSFGAANATVGPRITLRYPPINPVDPFFLREIARVRQDSASNLGITRRILRLNPGLLSKLTARANDNLAAVYVFKSCDDGNNFTVSSGITGTCINDATRSIGGGVAAFPARPWASTLYTAGLPAATTVSEQVMGGRSYIYSFVTRSRGFSDFVLVDSVPGVGYTTTDVTAALNLAKDTINSPLATSGPSTANIYAPITDVAARTYARIDTALATGVSTQVVTLSNIQNDVTGSTKLVYGNRFIVRKQLDSVSGVGSTTVTVQWVLANAAASATDAPTPNFVARTQTFSAQANIPVRFGTSLYTPTQRSTVGSARVFVDTLLAANGTTTAGAYGYVWVTSDNRPIFVTNDQYTTNQVRDQNASPLFPGFNVQSADTANASTGFRQEVTLPTNATRDRNFLLRSNTDTAIVNYRQFTPFVANVTGADNKRTRGGTYTLTWLTDPWGPGAPFLLDPIANLQGAISASLQAVVAKATTISDVSAATATLVGATAARPLQRVHIPFTVKFTDPNSGRTEDVRFAMRARISPTRLIGSGSDTTRVTIPDTLWMPGDTLIVLQKAEKDSTALSGTTRFFVVAPETIGGVAGFRPVQVLQDSIGINALAVACGVGATASGIRPTSFTDGISCNPLKLLTRGSSTAGGYLAVQPGWMQTFELTRGFDARSTIQLNSVSFNTSNKVTQSILDRIQVVPNPYLARSDVDVVNNRVATQRIYFTNVPEQGILRVYSISGQFLQELKWTRADLINVGSNTPSGDLPYNLRSREGIDLGSGLYLYVLTATGTNGGNLVKKGKFVIFR
ncbi:MAG: hypothetical protein ABJC26_16505 [Gemmatimonadaceae bacterium]